MVGEMVAIHADMYKTEGTIDCPSCGCNGWPSLYEPCCTACANKIRSDPDYKGPFSIRHWGKV